MKTQGIRLFIVAWVFSVLKQPKRDGMLLIGLRFYLPRKNPSGEEFDGLECI